MSWFSRLLSFLFIPVTLISAGILGYYSIEAARRFAEATRASILESTLLVVDEKIDAIEKAVIAADEAIFRRVDLTNLHALEEEWEHAFSNIAPSIKRLLVLDEEKRILIHLCRCTSKEKSAFLSMFEEKICPDLFLERAPIGQLRHLHHRYGQSDLLFSYRSVKSNGKRFYLVAQHDSDYFIHHLFPSIFQNEVGKYLFNIVNEENRPVFGAALSGVGEYLVGRNFPTTFYTWRLQVAPKRAPVLSAQKQAKSSTESALIALALVTVFVGVFFFFYAQIQERRLNQLKSEFLANVSHEFKTPLSVIRMFSELLLTKRIRDEAKERQYLESIVRESERLSALIENVLDFAAIERGKDVYDFQEGSILNVIQRAIEAFRARHDGNIEIVVRSEPGLPMARFDEQSLLIVFMNLLDNALKYGAPPFEIEVSSKGHHLVVKVRDHGPGIPREHHRRIFERFFRIPRPGSNVRGSGIGLAIVKHVVEAHGGRVWVEKADGGGAVIGFTVPRHQESTTERPSLTSLLSRDA
ncbi:MAG: HAMP domain-containing sensor histidine kinase [Sandaracinaceae bacterium]|nr:HAMP domain-containing sensor histidine kinase [Sandaracinaceae bacterium]